MNSKIRSLIWFFLVFGLVHQGLAQPATENQPPAKPKEDIWGKTNSKVHIAGYMHAGYNQSLEEATDSAFVTSFTPILHYSYQDFLLVEGELEFGIDEQGKTAIEMEYATLDIIVNDYLVIVTGRFLSPVGFFVQNLHPAWINKLPTAPAGFGHDGAAPVSDTGIQFRGGLPLGNTRFNYAVYFGNGPQFKAGHDAGEFELEQEGVGTEDLDGRKSGGGRLGFVPMPNLEVGASGAFGQVKLVENMAGSGGPTRTYSVLGGDLGYKPGFVKGLEVRGELIQTNVGGVAQKYLAADEQTLTAWYGQISYRLPWVALEPVFRYGIFTKDTGDETENNEWSIGVNYLLAPNAIIKLAFQNADEGAGHGHGTGAPADAAEHNQQILYHIAYGF